MSNIFAINDTLPNKISYYHLLLLMASLPFDMFYSHIILISFIVQSIIQFKRERLNHILTWQQLLILQSVFFVTVLSTAYSIDRHNAFNEWGKQLTILIMPIAFYISGFDFRKYREQLLSGFSLVSVLTVLYLFADALHIILHYKLPLKTLFSPAFTNHNFSKPIEMHATFFSMQVVMALVFLLTRFIGKKSLKNRAFYTLFICILLAGLVQLCSKSTLFCVLFVLNIAVPAFLLSGKRRWQFAAVAGVISVGLIFCIFRSGTMQERVVIALQTDFTKPKAGEMSDPRLARWETGTELIARSPIIGNGAGSEMGLLHDAFFAKKYYSSFLNNLNVHSEYLSFLIKSGIIGLLVYLATLFWGFRNALITKDLLFFTFMLLVAVVSFSENLLDVDKGIIFYAFFFSFFTFSDAEFFIKQATKIQLAAS